MSKNLFSKKSVRRQSQWPLIVRRLKPRGKPHFPAGSRASKSVKRLVKIRRIKTKKNSRWRKTPAKPKKNKGRITFGLNPHFEFAQELRNLVLKASPAEKGEILERLQKLGRIKLAVITGIFLNREKDENIPTDLLIVADDLEKRKLNSFLRFVEAEVGGEIRYVVLEKEEFQYRFSMFDRFVRVILEGPHEKLINKLGI